MGLRGKKSGYDPAYCEAVVEYCKDGASLTSFAASIGVSRRALTHWRDLDPDFDEAMEVAKAQIAAWYCKAARHIAVHPSAKGSATICIFGLKNFDDTDFKDRAEGAGREGSTLIAQQPLMSDIELARLIVFALAKAQASRAALPSPIE